MNTIQQQKAAKEFAAHWKGKGYERHGATQRPEPQFFWQSWDYLRR